MKIVGGKLLYRVCLHVSMTITILAKSKHAHGTETHNLDESLAKVEKYQATNVDEHLSNAGFARLVNCRI